MTNEITDKDLASIYSSLSSCSPLVRGLAERLRRVERELERERIRLAACGVVALCNTEESMAQQVIGPDNQYYSASYGDVVEAVKREIQHRNENTALRERMKRMEEALYDIRAECYRVGRRLELESFEEDDEVLVTIGKELIAESGLCRACDGTGEDGDPEGGTYACHVCKGTAQAALKEGE